MSKYLLLFLTTSLLLIPHISCGKAVIAGGAVSWKNQEIYEEFVQQASPRGQPAYIGIITAGITLSIARRTANEIAAELRDKYGVDNAEWLPYHPNNGSTCKSSAWDDKLNQMTGIYFNGGDAYPIISCLSKSSAMSIIKSRYSSGDLAIFGSSAGAMALQATPVRSVRESWNSLVYGSTYSNNAGFGIFNAGFIDVHFTTRGRTGALARFIYDYSRYNTVGFGIDQDTAFVTDDDDYFYVKGQGGVTIMDVSGAQSYNPRGNRGRWAVKNVRVSYLTDGDYYVASSGNIYFADSKYSVYGDSDVQPITSDNVFGDGEFLKVAKTMFQSMDYSTSGTSSESMPKFEVELKQQDDSIAYSDGNLFSFKNLYIDIHCVLNC